MKWWQIRKPDADLERELLVRSRTGREEEQLESGMLREEVRHGELLCSPEHHPHQRANSRGMGLGSIQAFAGRTSGMPRDSSGDLPHLR